MAELVLRFTDHNQWSVDSRAWDPTTLQQAAQDVCLQWQKNQWVTPVDRYEQRLARISHWLQYYPLQDDPLSESVPHKGTVEDLCVAIAHKQYNHDNGYLLSLYMQGPYTGLWFHPYPGQAEPPCIGQILDNPESIWMQCQLMAQHDLQDARWVHN